MINMRDVEITALVVGGICLCLGVSLSITSIKRVWDYQEEIQALHAQIKKQTCDENTIPLLKKKTFRDGHPEEWVPRGRRE